MEDVEILRGLLDTPLEELMGRADLVRETVKGPGVFLRAIVEFSNHCVRNCLYCGLRRDNTKLGRHRLDQDRILHFAEQAARRGVGTIVLQSGDDLAYPAENLAVLVRRIKERAEIAVTLSLGERPWKDYELWRAAGADRYLMKHETADPVLYRRLHPGRTLAERLAALRFLKSVGYETGTGFIVGLPGQTAETLVADVLLVRELGADMCGVGPFLPQINTPLGSVHKGSVQTTLRIIALLRLTCPDINLPATTAMATLDPENGQAMALRAGANVIMPSFTPVEFHKHYQIYDHKTAVGLETALAEIRMAGRTVIRDGGLK